MQDDQLPPLDDFEQDIKTVSYSHKAKGSASNEDYTKPNVRHLQDEEKQKEEIKEIEKKVEKIAVQVQSAKPKQVYGGLKKGFFSNDPKQKKQQITEVKVTKKSNPLEFKEVQESMKMNDYLESTKNQWMTGNFLNNVEGNSKIQKLMSNPENMKAITEFQKNPQQAMIKYGKNKEVMDGLMQFCSMMGGQFQNMAKTQKK